MLQFRTNARKTSDVKERAHYTTPCSEYPEQPCKTVPVQTGIHAGIYGHHVPPERHPVGIPDREVAHVRPLAVQHLLDPVAHARQAACVQHAARRNVQLGRSTAHCPVARPAASWKVPVLGSVMEGKARVSPRKCGPWSLNLQVFAHWAGTQQTPNASNLFGVGVAAERREVLWVVRDPTAARGRTGRPARSTDGGPPGCAARTRASPCRHHTCTFLYTTSGCSKIRIDTASTCP